MQTRQQHLFSARPLGALAALAAALTGVPARAQPSPHRGIPATAVAARAPAIEIEGAVLAVQGDELVVDLGAGRGATVGAAVEIWRPIKVKHPVTGKVLTDRFRIGSLELVQVRAAMALARPTAPLARPAAVGDVVILAVAAPAGSGVAVEHGTPAAPAAPPAPAASGAVPAPAPRLPDSGAEGAPEDPEARSVSAMFDALKGADLSTRIRSYEERVRAGGRFAPVLAEEANALRELLASRGVAAEHARPDLRSFAEPKEALAGSPLRVAVELGDAAAGAVLHVRRKGAPSYVPFPMTALGNGYFAATLPGDHVVTPAVEYFLEAISAAGQASAVVGNPEQPRELDVFELPRPFAPRKLPSQVEIATDYADYNRLRGNDYTWQTEGRFSVRYGDTGVRALRTGFGVYRGVGGSVDDLDRLHLAPRTVGLTYGWLETEIGVVRAFSFGGRVAVGLLDGGISGGGQLMVRIGSDLGTNLLIGGEVLRGLGLRGITQLELNTFARVPIVLRSEVTNQPAGVAPGSAPSGTSTGSGDIGVRGIAQVGYRFTPDLVVALRGSFQGRTIQHAGPGLGGAVGYSW